LAQELPSRLLKPLPAHTMQTRSAILLAALLAGYYAGSAAALRTQAQAGAAAWLHDHPEAQADELAELKTENPEAYAIVKALLTKRSLGLLDPRHPTASFAAHGPPLQASEMGAAAFAKPSSSAESGAPAGEQLYPEASAAPAHHDWLNWKPQDSAVDDEALVKGVLGSVASLTGQAQKVSHQTASPLEAEEAAFSDSQVTAQTKSSESSASSASAVAAAPASSEGVSGPLAAFSWDDKPAAASQQQAPATHETPSASGGDQHKMSALSSWLTGGKSSTAESKGEQEQHVEAPKPAVQPESNPYTKGLW